MDTASPLHLGVFRCKLGPDTDVLGPGASCALGLMLGSGALDRGQHLLELSAATSAHTSVMSYYQVEKETGKWIFPLE